MISSASRLVWAVPLVFGCSTSTEALVDGGSAVDGGTDDACVFRMGCEGPVTDAPDGFDPSTTCFDGCNWFDCASGARTYRVCGPDGLDECAMGAWSELAPVHSLDASPSTPVQVVDGPVRAVVYTPREGCEGCSEIRDVRFDPERGYVVAESTTWSDRPEGHVEGRGTHTITSFWTVSDAQVTWTADGAWDLPTGGTVSRTEGPLRDRAILDVAPFLEFGAAITHARDLGDGLFDTLAVLVYGGDPIEVPLAGVVQQAQLADRWLTTLGPRERPTIDVFDLRDEGRLERGTSTCRVASYDAAEMFDDGADLGVAVVQDCSDGSVELEARGRGTARIVLAEGHEVPTRLTPLSSSFRAPPGVAVVLVEPGADAPTVIEMFYEDDTWEVAARIRLPPLEGLRLPITSVDVASSEFGRDVVVAWTGSPNPGEPGAAYTSLRRCPCVDGDCF